MKTRKMTAFVVLALGLAMPGIAQQTGGGDHVTAIKDSLQSSMAALHGYKWIETTIISIKGEEKSRTESSCYYGADGKVAKTPLPGESTGDSKKPRGLRGRIAENKKAEITDSMQEAIALVKQYVPPDSARIQAAKESGKLSVVPPDDHGNVQLIIKDYLKPGDTLTLDANAATNRLSGMAVSSFTDTAKDAVGLEVSFGTLDDGTIYPATTDLTVASENLEVAISNTGYEKLGG